MTAREQHRRGVELLAKSTRELEELEKDEGTLDPETTSKIESLRQQIKDLNSLFYDLEPTIKALDSWDVDNANNHSDNTKFNEPTVRFLLEKSPSETFQQNSDEQNSKLQQTLSMYLQPTLLVILICLVIILIVVVLVK